VRFALVGCGNIAPRYAQSILDSDGIELAGATDVEHERAVALVDRFGGTAHASLDELLADPEVDAVVNLTPAAFHADITRAALLQGKHVHTEKPLALRHEDARGLVELARARGVRLSCSPATLLGDAQQTLWKLVREAAVGRVRVAYAEANWGRIESWHPSPSTLHSVGAMVDVGIYPLTILTAMFGPARRVDAYATTVMPDRGAFRLETPDLVVAAVELESGVVARVTASFYVGPGKQRGIELHGDDGMLYLASWAEFDSRLERADSEGGYEPVELVREPYRGIDWGRALVDLAESVRDAREPRAGGEHAAHVVEILDAIAQGGGEIRSEFEPPAPMEWAR
jgi:predicted dehydrogenase